MLGRWPVRLNQRRRTGCQRRMRPSEATSWQEEGPLSSGCAEDAELIALRVGQHDPGNDALTDLDALCAEVDESLNLELLIVRSKVEMKPVFGRRLGGTDWQEDDPREVFRFALDLELVRVVVDDGPSECSGPPLTERNWVDGVDDYLLPSKAHRRILREGRALRARRRATRGSAKCGALRPYPTETMVLLAFIGLFCVRCPTSSTLGSS